MEKLLVCDDKTLKKRGTIAANIRLIKQFIAEGNRFLLTTKGSIDELLKDGYDSEVITSIKHPINPLKKNDIQYTNLACYNGLYLYNEDNVPINCYYIDLETLNKLKNTPHKPDVLVDITEYMPDNDENDPIIGKIRVYICSEKKKAFFEANEYVKKVIKKSDQELECKISFDHDLYHSASYYIWPKDATVKNQIRYLMERYEIDNSDVCDLRGANPDALYSTISRFKEMKKKR